jgi:hypothetical protein
VTSAVRLFCDWASPCSFTLILLSSLDEPAPGRVKSANSLRRAGCDQRETAERSRSHLGKDEVVAFQRPAENASGMALRGRSSSLGAGTAKRGLRRPKAGGGSTP